MLFTKNASMKVLNPEKQNGTGIAATIIEYYRLKKLYFHKTNNSIKQITKEKYESTKFT